MLCKDRPLRESVRPLSLSLSLSLMGGLSGWCKPSLRKVVKTHSTKSPPAPSVRKSALETKPSLRNPPWEGSTCDMYAVEWLRGDFADLDKGDFADDFRACEIPPNQGAKSCFRICFWSAEFPLAAGKCDVYQSTRTLGGISRATKDAHLQVCGIPPVGDFADPKRRDFADLFWVPKTACANQHRQGVFRAPFEHRHANPHQNQKKRKGDSTY